MKRHSIYVFVMLCVFPLHVWSGCSPYMGFASLNEVSKEHPFFNNVDDFIEVKKLDNKLNSSVISNWTLEICETIFTVFISCSGALSLADANQIGKYWVYSGSPAPSSYIDWLGGFDVVLRDENNDVIDYLSVNNVTPQYEQCDYSYPISASGDNSTRRTARSPDGVGDWVVPPGNSVPPTEGEDNSSTPPPADAPSLQFLTDLIISQGDSAQVTFVLSSAYTSDVTIDFATANGSAIAGVDYVQSRGTVVIPAGSTQVAVTVNSLQSGNPVDTYFFMTIERATNADVIDQVAEIHIVQAQLANHFSILHSGMGVNCEPELISISARDASGNIKTNYTGTIQLATSTSHGDWSIANGQGIFTSGSADSGQGQYTFSATDLGEVQFYLSNTHVELININVVDGFNITENSNNALASDDLDLEFKQAIFKFLFDDGNSITDTFPVFTAGKPLNLDYSQSPILLRAITTDPDTGVCQSLFSGAQTIDVAMSCENAQGCDTSGQSNLTMNQVVIAENGQTVTNFTPLTLSFDANGTARLPSVIYDDAGLIRLHGRKNLLGSAVSGASNLLTFHPAGFCLSVNDNNSQCLGNSDAELAQCSVFLSAGSSFAASISAQGWQKDNDETFCDNSKRLYSFNHTVNLAPKLVAPSGGNLGYINSNSTTLSNGLVNLDLSWSEVGVMQYEMGGNDYYGQALPQIPSANVGRWTPAAFQLFKIADGTMSASNNGFSYVGEKDAAGRGAIGYESPPQFEYLALNALPTPDTLQNYVGVFNKSPLSTLSIASQTFGVDGLNVLSIVGDFAAPVYAYNTTTDRYSASLNLQDHFYFERNAQSKIAPFTQSSQITLDSFTDSDGITGNSLTFSPLGYGIRFGRLYVDNAYGPETLSIKQVLRAEYFDGQNFITNAEDTFTDVDVANIVNRTVVDVGDVSNPLLVTDTDVAGEFYNQGPLQAGTWTMVWQAPLNARYGEIQFQYLAPDWLTFDWNESGDGIEEGPTASVSFGQYRGHDNIIYWKEITF